MSSTKNQGKLSRFYSNLAHDRPSLIPVRLVHSHTPIYHATRVKRKMKGISMKTVNRGELFMTLHIKLVFGEGKRHGKSGYSAMSLLLLRLKFY